MSAPKKYSPITIIQAHSYSSALLKLPLFGSILVSWNKVYWSHSPMSVTQAECVRYSFKDCIYFYFLPSTAAINQGWRLLEEIRYLTIDINCTHASIVGTVRKKSFPTLGLYLWRLQAIVPVCYIQTDVHMGFDRVLDKLDILTLAKIRRVGNTEDTQSGKREMIWVLTVWRNNRGRNHNNRSTSHVYVHQRYDTSRCMWKEKLEMWQQSPAFSASQLGKEQQSK